MGENNVKHTENKAIKNNGITNSRKDEKFNRKGRKIKEYYVYIILVVQTLLLIQLKVVNNCVRAPKAHHP